MPQLDVQLFLILLGSFFLFAGLAGIFGFYKRWYWNSRRLVFAYVPVGVLFFLSIMEKSFTDPTTLTIFRMAEFALLGIAVWWLVRPPQFIIPPWIRLIEAHPKEVYTAMAAMVKEGEPWQEHLKTQAELEKWIVAAKKYAQKSKKTK